MDIKQAAKKTPANKRLSGNKWSVILTVASMAPMSFALWAKAPARIKIHIINMMFLLACTNGVLQHSLVQAQSFGDADGIYRGNHECNSYGNFIKIIYNDRGYQIKTQKYQ